MGSGPVSPPITHLDVRSLPCRGKLSDILPSHQSPVFDATAVNITYGAIANDFPCPIHITGQATAGRIKQRVAWISELKYPVYISSFTSANPSPSPATASPSLALLQRTYRSAPYAATTSPTSSSAAPQYISSLAILRLPPPPSDASPVPRTSATSRPYASTSTSRLVSRASLPVLTLRTAQSSGPEHDCHSVKAGRTVALPAVLDRMKSVLLVKSCAVATTRPLALPLAMLMVGVDFAGFQKAAGRRLGPSLASALAVMASLGVYSPMNKGVRPSPDETPGHATSYSFTLLSPSSTARGKLMVQSCCISYTVVGCTVAYLDANPLTHASVMGLVGGGPIGDRAIRCWGPVWGAAIRAGSISSSELA
ncbi:hypothetical protein S40293_10822 [Stachybotrys chartarum IBT 40293]|nr:hypothetical protein S40293_10822 [Stachybotrys chartarum IBT 40293]